MNHPQCTSPSPSQSVPSPSPSVLDAITALSSPSSSNSLSFVRNVSVAPSHPSMPTSISSTPNVAVAPSPNTLSGSNRPAPNYSETAKNRPTILDNYFGRIPSSLASDQTRSLVPQTPSESSENNVNESSNHTFVVPADIRSQLARFQKTFLWI